MANEQKPELTFGQQLSAVAESLGADVVTFQMQPVDMTEFAGIPTPEKTGAQKAAELFGIEVHELQVEKITLEDVKGLPAFDM